MAKSAMNKTIDMMDCFKWSKNRPHLRDSDDGPGGTTLSFIRRIDPEFREFSKS
jgi:hypothetical protein